MQECGKFCVLLMTCIGFALMTEKQAHAYADPGSSLLVLQTVGSVITASAIYFRRKIASFFHRDKKNLQETPDSVPSK